MRHEPFLVSDVEDTDTRLNRDATPGRPSRVARVADPPLPRVGMMSFLRPVTERRNARTRKPRRDGAARDLPGRPSLNHHAHHPRVFSPAADGRKDRRHDRRVQRVHRDPQGHQPRTFPPQPAGCRRRDRGHVRRRARPRLCPRLRTSLTTTPISLSPHPSAPIPRPARSRRPRGAIAPSESHAGQLSDPFFRESRMKNENDG